MPDELKKEPATPQEQANQIPTDYSALSTVYTNFCRVNITPEELVLDFGLNPQISPTPTEPVKLTHRVVMNFFTAKRLRGPGTRFPEALPQHSPARSWWPAPHHLRIR